MPKLRTFFSVLGFQIVIGSPGAAAPTSETAVNDGFTFGVCRVELFTRADPPYAQLKIQRTDLNSSYAFLYVNADEAVGWTANDITKIRDNCGVSGDALAFTDPTGNYYDTGSFGITYTTEAEGAVFAGYDISDTTAPSFDVAPSVGSATSSGFTPSASIDEAGVVYYVVVADGASAPSAAQVKTGQDATGSAAVAADSVTVSSSPFTSSFSAITSLSENTAYDVYFVAEDDEGTPNLQSSVTKVDATTADVSAPTLSSSSPADDATGVAVDANIELTFSENIAAGTGNITLYDSSDTAIEAFDVATADVTISGAKATINPSATLSSSTTYYVQVDATAIDDTSGNSFAGISDTTTLNFQTGSVSAAPTSLSITPGTTELTVEFTAPADTGSGSIVEYQYQLDGGSWVSTSSTSTSINITGLTDGTNYSIKVRAVTTVGDGEASSSISGTPGVPSAPTSLSVTAGDTKATLTFTAPANDGGSSITSYAYQIDGGSWVSIASTVTLINVNGLTNGTTYSFAVRAVNANGNGVASSSVSATPAEIPLLSAKFGIAQVFSDQSWSDYRPWGTDHRGILAQSVLDAMVANGRYFAFYQANRHDADEFGFAIFESNGSKYGDIASDITIREIGVDLISYRTNSRTNYITPSQGRLGSEVSGLSSDTTNPTVAQLQAFTPPLSVAINSVDTTAPTFDVAPSVGSATSSGFTPSASIDEAGEIYYVVVADSASAPSAAQVKAGQDATGSAAVVADSVTVSSSPFTSSFSAITSLSENTAYDVYFVAEDDEGTPNLQSSVTKVDATTADVSDPILSSSSPADDATGVTLDANIEMTFSEAVDTETGTIVIKKVSDGSTVESFDVASSSAISGSGTTTITINPTSNLSYSTDYYVEIAATAFDDAASNSYAGISGATTLNFTTVAAPTPPADTTAPTASFSPLHGTTGVAADSSITITFSEAVRMLDNSAMTHDNVGALLTLRDTDAEGDELPFTATVNGRVVTVDPTSDFHSSQQIYVGMSAGLEDMSNNAMSASFAQFTAADTIPPTVKITAPTEGVTGQFDVSIVFSETVTGFVSGDITITNGEVVSFSGAGTTYTASINPVMNSLVRISIAADVAEDAAGNGNEASDVVEIGAGSPSQLFAQHREAITNIIVQDAMRSLLSSVSASSRMVRDARGRLRTAERGIPTLSTRSVPLDVDGVATADGASISTRGTASAETSYNYGQSRRMIFGDFDIQHDSDTGSTTATLSGRVTWEQILQDSTLFGYFVGLEYTDSQIDGTFEGDQTRIGLTFGGYAVQRMAEHLYADGYLSMGLGDSDLDISNGTLDLQSSYGSQTITAGAALSGLYAHEQYEFRPELAINYGRTELGNIGLTGTAYGVTDDTLNLDAGSVTVTNLTVRPKILFAVDGGTVAQSRTVMSFAPRLICEQTSATLRADTDDCGGGAEIGFVAQSDDGLSSINFRIAVDEIGNTRRSTGNLGVELRF